MVFSVLPGMGAVFFGAFAYGNPKKHSQNNENEQKKYGKSVKKSKKADNINSLSRF